jgi:ABC-type multidrug transport system ATPase subunit
MTSHDFVRVQDMADRFDVLSRGRIIASKRSTELSRDGLQAFYRQALEDV